MSQGKIDFGNMTTIEDAVVLQDPGPQDMDFAPSAISSTANSLWEYHNLGTINGFPVAEDSKELPIATVDVLAAALEPSFTPGVFVCWLSPDDNDGFEAYSKLLKRAADREIVIEEETRQYDQAKSAFMVFVRYDEVLYRLHGRYEYLREEKENG